MLMRSLSQWTNKRWKKWWRFIYCHCHHISFRHFTSCILEYYRLHALLQPVAKWVTDENTWLWHYLARTKTQKLNKTSIIANGYSLGQQGDSYVAYFWYLVAGVEFGTLHWLSRPWLVNNNSILIIKIILLNPNTINEDGQRTDHDWVTEASGIIWSFNVP